MVNASGPARQAGIQAHDLLTGVGGQRITSLAELQEAVDAMRPGVACAIGIQREAQQAVVNVLPSQRVSISVVEAPKVCVLFGGLGSEPQRQQGRGGRGRRGEGLMAGGHPVPV